MEEMKRGNFRIKQTGIQTFRVPLSIATGFLEISPFASLIFLDAFFIYHRPQVLL